MGMNNMGLFSLSQGFCDHLKALQQTRYPAQAADVQSSRRLYRVEDCAVSAQHLIPSFACGNQELIWTL